MDFAEFLFPRGLSVSPSGIERVLVVGSCLGEVFCSALSALQVGPKFEFVQFNNVSDLPGAPPSPVEGYDFQYVQIPLRSVLTDQIVRFADFSNPTVHEAMVDGAFQRCRLLLEAGLKYNREYGLLTVVSNFISPQVPVVSALDRVGGPYDLSAFVRRLNAYLGELCEALPNVYLADLDSISQSLGKRGFVDDFLGFYGHGAYWSPGWREFDVGPGFNAPSQGRIETPPLLEEIYPYLGNDMFVGVWRQMESIYRTVRQIDQVKLVIFDLDDTLWRGLLADHYDDGGAWPVEHGWPLGVWEAVHHLRARGIMTALCSKNDEALVRARWARAVYEGWLTPDDFLFREINWRPKPANVAAIIEQASLTPRSVVFVDDNPVERAAVAAALPGIRTIGGNPYVTKRVLLWSAETQVATITPETAGREAMMRGQKLREAERRTLSRDEFLRGLGSKIELTLVDGPEHRQFARCLELINKSNQFNTNGQRRGASELTKWVREGGRLYAFTVADRFTNYGLVGVVLCRGGMFEQFVMSCRVIGLEIETSVLAHIIERERGLGIAKFTAVVERTEANAVCRDVYARMGFSPAGDGILVLDGEGAVTPIPFHEVQFGQPAAPA